MNREPCRICKGPMPIHFGLMAQRFHLSRIASRGFLRTPNWLVLPLVAALTAQSVAQEEEVVTTCGGDPRLQPVEVLRAGDAVSVHVDDPLILRQGEASISSAGHGQGA